MKTVETVSYPVSIFVAGDYFQACNICRAFCDDVGLCVTVTHASYAYTGGEEGGVIVGLINYGRFPSEPRAIFAKAKALALLLIDGLGQESATVQAPDKTLWLNNRPAIADTHAKRGDDFSAPSVMSGGGAEGNRTTLPTIHRDTQ